MRYRTLSATGDYVFGRGPGAILTNTPQAVGQAVYTRLRLQFGEVFWASDAGVPYETDVVGYGDKRDRDALMLATILGTIGVTEVIAFDSLIDPSTRRYGFSATLNTLYGKTQVNSQPGQPANPSPPRPPIPPPPPNPEPPAPPPSTLFFDGYALYDGVEKYNGNRVEHD